MNFGLHEGAESFRRIGRDVSQVDLREFLLPPLKDDPKDLDRQLIDEGQDVIRRSLYLHLAEALIRIHLIDIHHNPHI
jgi:hypothetical protein